jgi:hypothetical protein
MIGNHDNRPLGRNPAQLFSRALVINPQTLQEIREDRSAVTPLSRVGPDAIDFVV